MLGGEARASQELPHTGKCSDRLVRQDTRLAASEPTHLMDRKA